MCVFNKIGKGLLKLKVINNVILISAPQNTKTDKLRQL